MKRDPDKYREWQRASQRRYEDRLRAEGHHKIRTIGPNRERKAREFQRAYGGEERVEWVQGLPCVATGQTPCVNAHVPPADHVPSGMGRKADAEWIVPLTWKAHQELHQYGLAWFEAHYDVDLAAEAERIAKEWEER